MIEGRLEDLNERETNGRNGADEGGFGASVLGPKETVHAGLLPLKFLGFPSEELTFSQSLVKRCRFLKISIDVL